MYGMRKLISGTQGSIWLTISNITGTDIFGRAVLIMPPTACRFVRREHYSGRRCPKAAWLSPFKIMDSTIEYINSTLFLGKDAVRQYHLEFKH